MNFKKVDKYVYMEILEKLREMEKWEKPTPIFTVNNFPDFMDKNSVGVALKETKSLGVATQQILSIYYYVVPNLKDPFAEPENDLYLLREKVKEQLKTFIQSGELRPLYKITPIKTLGSVYVRREDFAITLFNL